MNRFSIFFIIFLVFIQIIGISAITDDDGDERIVITDTVSQFLYLIHFKILKSRQENQSF